MPQYPMNEKTDPKNLLGAFFRFAKSNPEKTQEILKNKGFSLKQTAEAMAEAAGIPVELSSRGRNVLSKTISLKVFNGKPKREVPEAWNEYERDTLVAIAQTAGMDPAELPESPIKSEADFENPFA